MEAAMATDSSDGVGIGIASFPHGTRVMRVQPDRSSRPAVIQMLVLIQINTGRELRLLLARCPAAAPCSSGPPLMWMAILAVLTATFVVVLK